MSQDKNENEVKALISLLDDTDTEVLEIVESQILNLGRTVIPLLEDAWSQSFDPVKQKRIINIIHKLQHEDVVHSLKVWHQGGGNLLDGAVLVARHQYPDLDEDKIVAQLNQIKRDIWLELNDNLTAYEKVKIINRVLFDMHQFKGNTANYHLPGNSYINLVLETKKGNPLLLSLIYMHLASQLDIPIFGINLPEHFILAYVDELNILREAFNDQESKVLFYINPFSKGAVFGRNEIDQFLDKLNIEHRHEYYEPCTNTDIIERMIRNLIFSYQKMGDSEKERELEEMLLQLK